MKSPNRSTPRVLIVSRIKRLSIITRQVRSTYTPHSYWPNHGIDLRIKQRPFRDATVWNIGHSMIEGSDLDVVTVILQKIKFAPDSRPVSRINHVIGMTTVE